jgi:hypothetical protein
MKFSLITLSLCLFTVLGFSQELAFNINDTYSKPVLKEQLVGAKFLKDIHDDYPSSWIADADYISTEISATVNGVVMKAMGQNEKLNPSQQRVLSAADIATAIDITVKYRVKNSITDEVVENIMNFSVSHVPAIKASYRGGEEAMNTYLKENAIDKIDQSTDNKFEFAGVKFFINKDGKVVNPTILTTSGDKATDLLLLETIKNMPKWNPAKDSKGNSVRQEFEFHVGNMIGC